MLGSAEDHEVFERASIFREAALWLVMLSEPRARTTIGQELGVQLSTATLLVFLLLVSATSRLKVAWVVAVVAGLRFAAMAVLTIRPLNARLRCLWFALRGPSAIAAGCLLAVVVTRPVTSACDSTLVRLAIAGLAAVSVLLLALVFFGPSAAGPDLLLLFSVKRPQAVHSSAASIPKPETT